MSTTLQDRINGVNQGAAIKTPCRVATTANITLSGEQTIDGVAVVAGDRVLVKDQTTGSENGIYVADTIAWERAPDFDGARDVVSGTWVTVKSGTGAGVYQIATSDPITIGTTSLSFSFVLQSTSITAFMLTLLDDTDAATALATLGALGLSGGVMTGDLTMGAGTKIIMEGTTDDVYEVILEPGDPVADVTITLQQLIHANATKALTAGYSATPYDAGTKSSGTYTPDEANGNMQYYVNGGAHTLAPPTNNCTLIIQCTNNGSAGAITTSGFTVVDGDDLTTTNGDDFLFYVTKINGFSHLTVKALQ